MQGTGHTAETAELVVCPSVLTLVFLFLSQDFFLLGRNEFVLIMYVIIVLGMFKSLKNFLGLRSIRRELVSVRC